jgi:hypothetical protein
MPNTTDSVIFSIVFKKGMANKNRLPLSHVIATLQQVDQMIREVGRQVQRDAGIEKPDGDFGIELLAGRIGIAFHKGSVSTSSAITRDVQHGIATITKIIETTDVIEKKRPLSLDEYGEHVLRRLPKVSEIQEQDKTELHLALAEKNHVIKKTKFTEKGRETLRSMESAELAVHGVTLYGKLRELKDFSRDDEGSGHFWGELLEDNGRKWRIKFSDSELTKALRLFRRQVSIFGDATYFKTKLPRVDVKSISEERRPDYVGAFDSFREAYADVFEDKEPQEILNDIREEIERICENRRRKWDCLHIATAQILECSAMYCTDNKMQKRQKQLGIKNLEIVPPPEPIKRIKGPLLEGVT